MLTLYFNIFQRDLSFECHISGFCVCHHCYRHGVLQCTTVREMFVISLVVEMLIYNKKYFSRIKTIHVFTST